MKLSKVFVSIIPILISLLLFYFTSSPVPLPQQVDPQALINLQNGLDVSPDADMQLGEFEGISLISPSLVNLSLSPHVLGQSTGSSKRIEVDLTNQKVYTFEGDKKIHEFLVSTGKYYPTPTGEFTIWIKVRSQKMSGGSKSKGTYYYLPNVPYVMFFYNNKVAKATGFSFHGAYWHENWGHPMSHGCVNMRIEDAKTLYEWATPVVTNTKAWSTLAKPDNPGTKVIIYGVTPKQ